MMLQESSFVAHKLRTPVVLMVCLALLLGAPTTRCNSITVHQLTQGSLPARLANGPTLVLPLNITVNVPRQSLEYQQYVTIDPMIYNRFLNRNLSNILFTYQNGTPVNAWIQSNATNSSTRTGVWLNLGGELNRTLYMLVYPENVSMLGKGSYVGEAPQLSPVYGEFDNGARVFPFYDDFEGTTLNASTWQWSGTVQNFTISNGLALGNNQWGGLLSNELFNASNLAPGLLLNYSQAVYLNVAVGTNSHVRLVGSDGRYFIGEGSGFFNSSFSGTHDFGFFSFWSNQSEGHISLGSQVLSISYNYAAGPVSGEQLSIRSSSAGWIYVDYALLRVLPIENSDYMPNAVPSAYLLPINQAGLYPVAFLETGLPPGQWWSVTLIHVGTFRSTWPNQTVALSNGTYPYLVESLDLNYSPTAGAQTLTVAGENVSAEIQFGHTYVLIFQETGLQLGWLWTVMLGDNQSASSYSDRVILRATNGTYDYTATSSDPEVKAATGFVEISGNDVTTSVTFVNVSAGAEPFDAIVSLAAFSALGILAVVLVVVSLRRKL